MREYLFTEKLLVTTSVISAFGSFSVILSGILFPVMRTKKFTQLIFLISLCDMLGNIFGAFGFPENDSPLCPTQGALRTFFYRASWMWTVVLTYQLFCTVCFGVIGVSRRIAHAVVWLISVLLLVLPFSTNQYGQDDQLSGIGWCSISGNTLDAGIWLIITNQIPISLSILANIWYVIQMKIYVDSNVKDLTKFPQITNALRTLMWYPIVMIIAWLPSTVYSPLINFRGVPLDPVHIFIMGLIEAWGGLYGFWLMLIFYSRNKEAQLHWKRLYFNLFPSKDSSKGKDNLRKSILAGSRTTARLNEDGVFEDNDDDSYNYYTGSSHITSHNSTNHSVLSRTSSLFSGHTRDTSNSESDASVDLNPFGSPPNSTPHGVGGYQDSL